MTKTSFYSLFFVLGIGLNAQVLAVDQPAGEFSTLCDELHDYLQENISFTLERQQNFISMHVRDRMNVHVLIWPSVSTRSKSIYKHVHL